MQFVDTHCHIHSADYPLDEAGVRRAATDAGVTRLICVGTDERDSARAVDYVQTIDGTWASIGLHPHDAKLGQPAFDALAALADKPKVVAVGECGLDYYYNYSAKEDQMAALHFQIQLALAHDLAMIFHIRDAFEDFWPIFNQYSGIRGVVHCFTATQNVLQQVLDRGLYVGLNGIMTFTKDEAQLAAAKSVPLDKLVLETDAPFLTPVPLRGKVNESKNVVLTAEFLATLRGESLEQLAAATTQNAQTLFNLT